MKSTSTSLKTMTPWTYCPFSQKHNDFFKCSNSSAVKICTRTHKHTHTQLRAKSTANPYWLTDEQPSQRIHFKKTYSHTLLKFISLFLFLPPLSCTRSSVAQHWPEYTPLSNWLQWAYRVSRLAIHISVSLVMTVNAAARIDTVKRQIPAT